MRFAASRKRAGPGRTILSQEIVWRRQPLSRASIIRQRYVVAQKKWSDLKTFPANTLPSSRIRSIAGDEEHDPHEETNLESFFNDADKEEQDDEEMLLSDSESDASSSEEKLDDDESEDLPIENEKESEEDTDDKFEDVTGKDRLAYERLIIEGGGVENAEERLKILDEKVADLEETFLDGSAYDTALELPPKPIKKLKDFPYKPLPKFSMQLVDLLKQAKLEEEAQLVQERWEDVTITGLHSRAENVTSGSIYFAHKTDEYDGRKDILLAVENGAVAILLQDDIEISAPEETTMEFGNGVEAEKHSNEPSPKRAMRCADREQWKQSLKEEGMPIDDIESLLPVLPILNLPYAMSSVGCVFYGFPSSKMKVIGILGTHGKTSTAWILRQILEEFKVCTGMMCDIEYAILGDQLTAEGDLFIPEEEDPTFYRSAAAPYHLTPYTGRYCIDNAVPDPLQVQKVLAGMAYRGSRACIIECSLDALTDQRLENVDFDVMVYTNLEESEERDTTETFKQKKSIYAALFRKIDIPEGQRVIVNIDDPHAQEFIDQSSEVPVVTYAVANITGDVAVESITSTIWESELIIRTPIGKMQIITPLVGKYHLYNILASVATAISIDIKLPTVVTGIESLDHIPGRCEVVDEGQDFSVVVDSANTASRLTSLIENMRTCGARKVFLVFGCCGHHSLHERALMGSVAHYHADVVIITSDSPAGESPEEIIDDIVAGFPDDVLKRSELWVLSPWQDPGRVPWWFEEWLFKAQKEIQRHIIEDRCLAIRAAIGTARKGDVVLIAGRGHKDFAWWSDKDDQLCKSWFEDRKEVRDALIKLPHLRKSRVVTDRLPWTEPERTKTSRLRF